MKRNTMRFASLFMAFAIFMTSHVTVSASGTDAAAAQNAEMNTDVNVQDGTENKADGSAAANTENGAGGDAENGTNGDAQTGTGSETGGSDHAQADPDTDSSTLSGSGAAPVEGEIVPGEKDTASDTGNAPVEGGVIQDKNNDKVEIKKHDKPYLALGADLSDAQRAAVLSIMGIDPAKLSEYDVVYITNDQEHAYLDAYINPAQIGTRSLSSVVIMERGKGSGLNISTNNITYCTVGMYKNALVTAGITDADIIVAGPTGISGTAALVGIFKAYQEMTGETVDEAVVDAALNELVITGELAESLQGFTNEEVEEFIAYIKSVIAKNDLKDEAGIREAVDAACDKYGVTLSDAERQKIVDLLLKITSLGIDLNGLVDYAESLYNSFKNGGGNGGILSSIGDFFTKAFTAIADFFKGLFSRG